MTELPGKYQVSLCRKSTCCPQLIIENDQYIITDDFGGKVVLEKEHIKELIGEYYNLTESPEEICFLHEAELKGLFLSSAKDVIEGKRDGSIYTLQGSSNLVLCANQKK